MPKKETMEKYAARRNKEKKADVARPAGGPQSKSVDIKRAENGFIVSQWIPGMENKPSRERLIICKTMQEAQAKAANLLKF